MSVEERLRSEIAQLILDREEAQTTIAAQELELLSKYHETMNLRSALEAKDSALKECRAALNEKIEVIGKLRNLLNDERNKNG